MKRYLVFAYYAYYPSGGLGDVEAESDDKIVAIAEAAKLLKTYDYVEVFDCQDRVVVFSE